MPYALAVSGVKPVAGPSPAARVGPAAEEPPASPLKFAARFVAGSAAGAAFVPIAAVLALRARRAPRGARDEPAAAARTAPPATAHARARRDRRRIAARRATPTSLARGPRRAADRRARPPRRARVNPARSILWCFGSRPHTVIGTALSVIGLYAIAAAEGARGGAGDLLATLVAALTVNIAIVGVNQLTDVEIDRVNKPFLPIAAGDLARGRRR